ncbi:hypothetical protein BKP42_68470 [Rhodococcus erythropolis]|nr:hypothetical protein BKP42_68470 [Rhodococcus erythropolis]
MRITPEPLHRRVQLQRATTGTSKDLVHRPHRPPCRSSLRTPTDRTKLERNFLPLLGHVPETIHRLQDRSPRSSDLGRRLTDREQHVRIFLDRNTTDCYTLTLRSHVARQRTLRDTDQRRGDSQRENARERELVQRLRTARFLPRRPVVHLSGVDRAVGGQECVLDDQVLRPGSAQAHDIPAVLVDVVIGARQQYVQVLRRHQRLTGFVTDHRADHDPVTVIGTRGERPAAVEDVPTLDRPRYAHRRIRRRHPRIGIGSPHLFLSLAVEERKLPRMHTDDAADPTRGTVHRADSHCRLGEFTRMRLEASEFLRLQHPDDARVAQSLRAAVRQAHQLVALDSVGADLVGEL